MKLRDYQQAAVAGAFNEWMEHDSTLIVMPTGSGKTQVFAEIVRRTLPRRSIVLVHREELAAQAFNRITQIAGVECGIEMADQTTSDDLFKRQPCIVASVQTLCRRLDKFRPEDFGLLICDEAHHCPAPTWKKIIEHFKRNENLKVLGVTATPDRTDEEALGQIFDTVAYDYEILDAINDGWLVPVDQQMVTVGDLDFSGIRTTAGDLNGADLAAVMETEQNVQGMVGSAIELITNRSSILFASSVRHAEMACEIFNRHRPDMAGFVCGETATDARQQILTRFQRGELQVLCNVGVATEGFDAPRATIILNGRPTKSRALYAQIAGRVLRPLPGLVDGLESREERKRAIADSTKPAALIIDYVGNSGQHKLMSCADILGGNASDEAIAAAVRKAKETGAPTRIGDAIQEEEERIEAARLAEQARKAKVVARVKFASVAVDPFNLFDISRVKERGWDRGKKLSEKQRLFLAKQGVDGDAMPYAQAKGLIDQLFLRMDRKLCSYKQAKILRKAGYTDTKTLSMKEASSRIDALAANGWRKPEDAPKPSPVAGVSLENYPKGKPQAALPAPETVTSNDGPPLDYYDL